MKGITHEQMLLTSSICKPPSECPKKDTWCSSSVVTTDRWARTELSSSVNAETKIFTIVWKLWHRASWNGPVHVHKVLFRKLRTHPAEVTTALLPVPLSECFISKNNLRLFKKIQYCGFAANVAVQSSSCSVSVQYNPVLQKLKIYFQIYQETAYTKYRNKTRIYLSITYWIRNILLYAVVYILRNVRASIQCHKCNVD